MESTHWTAIDALPAAEARPFGLHDNPPLALGLGVRTPGASERTAFEEDNRPDPGSIVD